MSAHLHETLEPELCNFKDDGASPSRRVRRYSSPSIVVSLDDLAEAKDASVTAEGTDTSSDSVAPKADVNDIPPGARPSRPPAASKPVRASPYASTPLGRAENAETQHLECEAPFSAPCWAMLERPSRMRGRLAAVACEQLEARERHLPACYRAVIARGGATGSVERDSR